MKQKIWIVSYDDFDGIGSTPFGTEVAANAEFNTMVSAMWERLHPGKPEPDNAYDVMTEDLDCDFSYSVDEYDIDVPYPKFDVNIEAALCSWEWILEKADDPRIDPHFDGLGSPGMRMVSVQAGQIVLTVYDLMEARGLEFTFSYDFDFVPAVLDQLDWEKLTENNQYGDGTYRPDPAPLLEHMLKTMPDRFSDRWMTDATSEAKKQWSFPGMLDEFEDRIDRTETPAEWVKRIGEKYDLMPATPY